MKITEILLLVGSSEAIKIEQSKTYAYPFGQDTYNDVRSAELKCIADRNKEWHYDGTGTGSCVTKSYHPYEPFEPEHDIRAQANSTAQAPVNLATMKDKWTYPFAEDFYNDIRSQQLKCLADRNREWHYDGATNTGTCTLKSYHPYVPYEPEHDIRAQTNRTSLAAVDSQVMYSYPFGEDFYNDIRNQELKCLADRNREWHYDASTNTGTCTLKSYHPYEPYEPEHDIRAQVKSEVKDGWTYPFAEHTYEDIRSQELKCLADRNREWHFDASTNTGSCTLKSYHPYEPYEPEHDIRAQISVTSKMHWTYPFSEETYNDIRSQELKCLSDRNREWHFDASAGDGGTGTCVKKSYEPYVEHEVENDIRAQKNTKKDDDKQKK